MPKREELLEQGIGDVTAVCRHYAQMPENIDPDGPDLLDIGDTLAGLLLSESGRAAVLAIVASVMNTEFTQTGRLWKVKADGNFGYTYISDQMARDVVAAAM